MLNKSNIAKNSANVFFANFIKTLLLIYGF